MASQMASEVTSEDLGPEIFLGEGLGGAGAPKSLVLNCLQFINYGHCSMTYDLPNKAKKMLPKRLKTSFHGIFTLSQPTVNKTEW